MAVPHFFAIALFMLGPGNIGYSCLKLIALHVPDSIFVGEIAKLSCIFDEEHEQLYSVKWYKDDVEFFRFLPNDRPANQFFSIGDVDVDMSRSSNGTVTLQNASHMAEGNYRCEVSVDAPSFQSTSQEKYMAVEGCTPGIFGENCESVCHCKDGPSACDSITGVCTGECAAGFTGPNCQIEIPKTTPQPETCVPIQAFNEILRSLNETQSCNTGIRNELKDLTDSLTRLQEKVDSVLEKIEEQN